MSGLHTIGRVGARGRRRVGRGQSSGAGKTSGRGTKGQNARSGRKKRPEWRDIIKKLPKRRGYGKNRGRTVVSTRVQPTVISLERLETLFSNGSEVSLKTLKEYNLLNSSKVKIVGTGSLTKQLKVVGCAVSVSARAAILKAGGSVA